MKKITPQDRETASAYAAAKPKQFGNLHERMKFVMRGLEEARGWKTSEPDRQFDEDNPDLVQGLFDLESEIKYTVPAKPPFATRPKGNRINSLNQIRTPPLRWEPLTAEAQS